MLELVVLLGTALSAVVGALDLARKRFEAHVHVGGVALVPHIECAVETSQGSLVPDILFPMAHFLGNAAGGLMLCSPCGGLAEERPCYSIHHN